MLVSKKLGVPRQVLNNNNKRQKEKKLHIPRGGICVVLRQWVRITPVDPVAPPAAVGVKSDERRRRQLTTDQQVDAFGQWPTEPR